MVVAFAYWCGACHGWWNAEITDAEENKRLRRHHARSRDVPGVWHHPGRCVCPVCGTPSTQHLPTEVGSFHTRRFLKRENRKSERPGLEQVSEAV